MRHQDPRQLVKTPMNSGREEKTENALHQQVGSVRIQGVIATVANLLQDEFATFIFIRHNYKIHYSTYMNTSFLKAGYIYLVSGKMRKTTSSVANLWVLFLATWLFDLLKRGWRTASAVSAGVNE